ncbi:RagB/SusD family nutrient uptake outer membrane protein [Pedobacter frigoris]|uniref:RagB/SusD family nutrient uptake outer membrane protein n=1 Tax=Pedobacter frigoris TaxID=2571272 RepID=A0A4U1CAX9_9SPHI|nr:RagB/SusD family nutrient uptake outer membrane protein [Pedobacter frigoris]TKC03673.1 RagB/SusD family nutrient uptake outer membrane protein [Pedobacter frigoris]
MKKIIKQTWIIGIAVLALAMVFPSCKKQINLAPENATYDEVFWVDGANVNKALSGAYSMLRDAFRADNSYFIFGDIAANNIKLGGDFWNYNTFVETGGFNFNYAPYLEGSVKNWSRFYAIITQCHQIVEKAPGIPDSKYSGGAAQKKRMIGEAKFLRAYLYFYLQRVWGDVILTKETIKDPTNVPPVPRSPESETLAYCLSDLKSATSMLDNLANKTRANKVSVLALTAQIYAWQKDYVNAEKYCDSVINNSPVSLEAMADYKNIWMGNSQESIFELNMKFDAVNNEANSSFFGRFLTSPYINNKNANSTFLLNPDLLTDIFDADHTDDRYDAVTEQAQGGGTNRMLTKYTNVNYYDPNAANTYVVSNNLVLIRLADVYLLRAEARYMNNKLGDALSDLNVIRVRAGRNTYPIVQPPLPAPQVNEPNFLTELMNERIRELIGEGVNMFDLIRIEYPDTKQKQIQERFPTQYSNDRIAKKGYFWPLDMRTLLKQDELLTQNEWWNNN